MRKFLFFLTTAITLLSACQNEEASPNEVPDQNKVMVNIAVDNGENGQDTKSVITQAENGIANITLFFFLDGKLTESIYTVPESDGTITIESTKGYASDASVDVYGLVNMGDQRSLISEGGAVSTLKSWQYTLASMSDINTSGFPMAGIEESAPVGTAFTLTVHRLVAKYGFQINTSGLKYGSFTVTGLKLRNTTKTVTPFTEGSKATSTSNVMDGDYATSDNVNTLKNGGGVYFYTLENMQGTLLSGNTDPWKKIPSYIGTSADLCTYIEVTGTYKDNSGGLTATHTYKMYLGQDNITNFDVIRNTKYEYTLTLADDGFLKATWKAEREITSDTRTVAFGASKYEVEYDEDCAVTMNFNPGTVPCKYTLSSNLTAAGVTFDSNYMVLRQTKELDADVTGTLTATSWDGVKTATCTVVAKEYKPGDIIIIITPTSNTVNMTEPTAQSADLELALVNPDDHTEIYETYDATDWTVSQTNSTAFSTALKTETKATGYTVEITGINAGAGYITATCKYDGVTYTSTNDDSNKITVNEDRTIKIEGIPTTIYKGQAYPCTITTNYTGDVNLSTSTTDLIFADEASAESTLTLKEVVANTPQPLYVRYAGSTNTTVSLEAKTTNSSVSDNISVKAEYIKSISLNYGTSPTTVYTAQLIQIQATANYSDGTTSDVTEDCTYTALSSYVVYSGQGTGVMLAQSVGTGAVTVTYQDCTATAVFKVENNYPKSIIFNPTSVTLQVGQTVQASVLECYGMNGNNLNPSPSSITWTSNNTSVATVTNGLIKAISAGSTQIIGQYTLNGKTVSNMISVTVQAGSVAEPSSYVTSWELVKTYTSGDVVSLQFKITYNNGTTSNVPFAADIQVNGIPYTESGLYVFKYRTGGSNTAQCIFKTSSGYVYKDGDSYNVGFLTLNYSDTMFKEFIE